MARVALAVFLDFDGTLVEIAETPGAIKVPGSFSARLDLLSDRLGGRLALVSGRGIEDLENHCGALAVAVAGSHGADRRMAGGGRHGPSLDPLPPAVIAEIEAFALREVLDLERKPHGAALHSRMAPDKEVIALRFMEALAQRHGLNAKPGKKVVELVHRGADKGRAVDAFMSAPPFIGTQPVFIGDDLTDEDGFAACRRWGGFGIVVGDRPSEQALYRLSGPAAVRQWLQL
jgi:trehalose 6-phosphate phosphatase